MGRLFTARTLFVALFVLGVAALAVSFGLEPTPDHFERTRNYGRIRVDATMHAVDYVIIALRIGGVVALLSGAYLTYRSFRPDRINESEAGPSHGHDRYEDIPPEAGNPSSRAGVNFTL
jgi:hypothetical protein